LAGQLRRASNSSPANLAEKHSDRHLRNKIEGVNKARGEALESIHHLFVASLKGYITDAQYDGYRERNQECVRMLNGMERSLEKRLPERDRRWPDASRVAEPGAEYFWLCEPRYPIDDESEHNRTSALTPPSLNPLNPEP
jgi:four helix bundle protein